MISTFDMFSIGIGPSSSHTVGPMRAAFDFLQHLKALENRQSLVSINAALFGSLGQTGVGHGSDIAVILGLAGHEPDRIDSELVPSILSTIEADQGIHLADIGFVPFTRAENIILHQRKTLSYHSNAMTITALGSDDILLSKTYYSIGGGFILDHDHIDKPLEENAHTPPKYKFDSAEELLTTCRANGLSIAKLMYENERQLNTDAVIDEKLLELHRIMVDCIQRGCRNDGILPGGLNVRRRAPGLFEKLQAPEAKDDTFHGMDFVNMYAMAVNEENAAGGRVVTAPTNGAAGIIPAVMYFYDQFVSPLTEDKIKTYLLTCAAIGTLYKKNASISGAEVGCQGEVGVACSMAAAGLTAIRGGTLEQVEHAAEIGMEHNLGLTCDPVAGLVQIPCIERNAIGAVKAINASRMARMGTGDHKVSLDQVIKTMKATGDDMKNKYKETSKGGLAINVTVC
ncbi:L-serine ammonia-lyase [Moritella sp. F3]|uniref:L-serine ammonia-lyase n=1 Tax=Moritella sp. F3 TaxID=2718882 RepID=UPI0018E10587|nr:L-serine ammonia-lyase [Moritella sp. F3]GIC76618.1 L-serine ammonia-lyase [Moritella sp. F1]GIC81629.1 L-serine ammonia-lyase [Moritella sp. F3]